MKKAILMMAMFLSSVSAFADIRWNMVNVDEDITSRVVGLGIYKQALSVQTLDGRFEISNKVCQEIGLSMKELLDLIKEYDSAKDKTLTINGSTEITGQMPFTTLRVNHIDSLVIFHQAFFNDYPKKSDKK